MSQYLSSFSNYLITSLEHISGKDIKKYFKYHKKIKLFVLGCSSFMMMRYVAIKLYRKHKNLPPGPIGLPFLGYFPQKYLYLKYRNQFERFSNPQLSANYGPIFMYNTPQKRIIVINSSSLTRKILKLKPKKKNKKSKKHHNHNGHILNRGHDSLELLPFSNDDGTRALGQIEYPQWINRRKLAHNSLFTMCTSSFVNDIIEDSMFNIVMPTLNNLINDKELFYPKQLCSFCSFNTIFHSSFGRSSSLTDPDGLKLRQLIDESFRRFVSFKLFLWNNLTFVRLFGDVFKPNRVLEIQHQRCELVRKLINERERKFDPNNATPLFIDNMLAAKQNGEITQSQMEADIMSLFSAGTDTTASALEHCLIYLCKYQDIQKRVREELLNQFPPSKDSKINKFDIRKLSKLPLFRSFFKEVLRVASIAKFGVPHSASDDIFIQHENKKYFIPKNSEIQYSIQNVNYDTTSNENWLNNKNGFNSEDIVLENWLNKDNRFKTNDSEIFFGYGHRDCIGKMLAEKELHIIIGYLLLNYKFTFQNQNNSPQIKHMNTPISTIYPEIPIKVEHLKQN